MFLKLFRSLVFALFLCCKCFAQTDSTVLANYNSLEEWETPHEELAKKLTQHYSGGRDTFVKDILRYIAKNLKHPIGSIHYDDHVLRIYLIQLQVSRDSVIINFKNQIPNRDRAIFRKAFQETLGSWKNDIPMVFNLGFIHSYKGFIK